MNGPLVVDDVELLVRAALDGIGLAFVSDERVESQLESGELIRVLGIGVNRFPDSSFSIRAADNRQPLWRQ